MKSVKESQLKKEKNKVQVRKKVEVGSDSNQKTV